MKKELFAVRTGETVGTVDVDEPSREDVEFVQWMMDLLFKGTVAVDEGKE